MHNDAHEGLHEGCIILAGMIMGLHDTHGDDNGTAWHSRGCMMAA